MRSLSTSLLTQLFAQQSDEPFVILYTFSHPSFPADMKFVNNPEPINGFEPFLIDVTLASDDEDAIREVNLTIDNVSLELIETLRSITEPAIQVKMQFVLTTNPSHIEIEFDKLILDNIQYNKHKINATLIIDDFLNTGLLHERYTPNNFAGIFR